MNLDTINIISLLQCLLGMTRPFPVMHSGWEKMKEEHKDVWVPCLNCLQRDLLLYIDCRMEERFGFFLPLQPCSMTSANFAVLDISHDVTPHTVPGHVVTHSSCKLKLSTLSPAKEPHSTRFIEVKHHRTPKEIQEKHCAMRMFRLVPVVAGSQHCYTNQSLLPVLWARVQYYKSTYPVCYIFCIKRIKNLLSYIHKALLLFFNLFHKYDDNSPSQALGYPGCNLFYY